MVFGTYFRTGYGAGRFCWIADALLARVVITLEADDGREKSSSRAPSVSARRQIRKADRLIRRRARGENTAPRGFSPPKRAPREVDSIRCEMVVRYCPLVCDLPSLRRRRNDDLGRGAEFGLYESTCRKPYFRSTRNARVRATIRAWSRHEKRFGVDRRAMPDSRKRRNGVNDENRIDHIDARPGA